VVAACKSCCVPKMKECDRIRRNCIRNAGIGGLKSLKCFAPVVGPCWKDIGSEKCKECLENQGIDTGTDMLKCLSDHKGCVEKATLDCAPSQGSCCDCGKYGE
jgi:hypothetical protein